MLLIMEDQAETTEAEVGTWKCMGCGSVCSSDPQVKPSPCDFCGSEDIVPLDPSSGEVVNH